MTVAKLIEVLQRIPDQEKCVYVYSSTIRPDPCRIVKQDDDGDIVLSNYKSAQLYFYPTLQTKGEDK